MVIVYNPRQEERKKKEWREKCLASTEGEVLAARSHRFSRFLFLQRSKRVSLIFQLVNIREL